MSIGKRATDPLTLMHADDDQVEERPTEGVQGVSPWDADDTGGDHQRGRACLPSSKAKPIAAFKVNAPTCVRDDVQDRHAFSGYARRGYSGAWCES